MGGVCVLEHDVAKVTHMFFQSWLLILEEVMNSRREVETVFQLRGASVGLRWSRGWLTCWVTSGRLSRASGLATCTWKPWSWGCCPVAETALFQRRFQARWLNISIAVRMIVTPMAVSTLGLRWWIIPQIMQALTCDSKEKMDIHKSQN